jgi:hypothetical protein
MDLSNISGTKLIKHTIYCDEGFEETFDGLGIAGPRLAVIAKWDRIMDFIRPTMELRCAA